MKWERFSHEPKTLTLYGYWRSSASWRLRWAFELKKIEYETVSVNILTEEHLAAEHRARSPMGTLPVLGLGEGVFLSESMAILEWIEEVYHLRGPSLFPGTPLERARIRQLCEIIAADTAPLQTPRAQKRHSSDAKERSAWARHFIEEGLATFDQISRSTRKSYAVYDEVTAADLCLVPQIYNALRFEIPVKEKFPELFGIYERALETEACKKAAPNAQADAPKN